MTRPLTVLFLENGAPARAPMAAGLLENLARGRLSVQWAAASSAPVPPAVHHVMQEIDVPPGTGRCQGEGPFDVVVVLLDPGACPPFDAGEGALDGFRAVLAPAGDTGLVPFRVHWRVPDPAGPLPDAADGALVERLRPSRDALRAHVSALVEHGYLAAMERHLRSAWEALDHPRPCPPAAAPPGGAPGHDDASGEERFHGMVARSGVLRDVFRTVRQLAASDYPVLVTGESGTGKELIAAAIHAESRRSCGPFVPINCGALPETILESELFGHVRGAFTGAIRDKKGRFELAHGGTLFLDEVGELTPVFQVKLLRVLQTKTFERVGGERPVTADVRIISATNRDLRDLVREGTFREDLFYRLCVVPIVLPPLRERPEDVLPIADNALRFIREETDREDLTLSEATRRILLTAPWPGNARQLINTLQFAAVHCAGDVIEPGHLPPEVRAPLHLPAAPDARQRFSDERGRPRKLDLPSVRQALAATDGNKARAARLLGVSRATLYRFLDDEGLGA